MQGLYALLGMGGIMCALGHWITALPVFLGLLFSDHHPEESVFTSSFIAWGRPGFPLEGLDVISPFVFLVSAALWFIPLRLLHDAIKGADKPDK